MKETGKCAICGGKYEHFGNNPEPLGKFEERVCNDCNASLVVPARLGVKTATIKELASRIKRA